MAGLKSKCAAVIFALITVMAVCGGFFGGRISAEKAAAAYRRDLIGRFGAAVCTADGALREEMAYAYTGAYTEEQLSLGRELLSVYGCSETGLTAGSDRFGDISLFSGLCSAAAALCAALACGGLLAAVMLDTRRGIMKISERAERICRGQCYPSDSCFDSYSLRVCSAALSRISDYTAVLRLQLEKEEQYIRTVLSDISHQMKNPIAALRMNTEIILREGDMPEETRQDFLTRSLSQLDRLEWLISGLLRSARLDSGDTRFDIRRQKLRSAADEAVKMYSEAAADKGVTVKNNVPEDMELNMDIRWISEALGNLIKNSLEHISDGGEIVIGGSETPLTAVITVTDNGSGIPPEIMPRIFDRFCSGSGASNTASVSNVGIGLAVTKSVVERHNGSIRASSDENGTVFTITFIRLGVNSGKM